MNSRNVRLIYAREIRDQLRDRRTLFMIAVLPMLLYPLLGMSVFQLSQFVRKSEPKVLVIGGEAVMAIKDLPILFEGDHFAADLFDDGDSKWLNLEFENVSNDAAEQRLKSGEVQVVLSFPPDFGERLQELREQLKSRAAGEAAERNGKSVVSPPEPQLQHNSGKEKSQVAFRQVEQILGVWRSQIVRENLLASRVPDKVARPFELQTHDVAEHNLRQALMWSKILPFVLFIWALTGAFYPAVDLCAGEKERGTLETLLSSPAARTEIVWGKLLTVMTFSAATAALNLTSLGLTARFATSQLKNLPLGGDVSGLLQMPPLASTLWLLVGLVPMSALFGALCLACAAFARSTKEGQYYLMPLFLICMPLMMLPLAPGTELNLGNSLIPITGVVLLLMSLVQGDYAEALRYCVPVIVVTLVCCHWAIRWAVYQFNQESVLFRESERLDPRRWLIHLVRDRQDTPSMAQAFLCVTLMFVIQFFMRLAIMAHPPSEITQHYVVLTTFVGQVVCFAVPALLMAILLTGRPLKTLSLDHMPSVKMCAAGVLLAVLLHPLGIQLVQWIRYVYPLSQEALNEAQKLGRVLENGSHLWLSFLLLGLLPAFCEELAFRGFVLSGLRHLGSKWWAIGLTAVFFGTAHMVVQQSISAALIGFVIGYIAVQTGSLVPCMLFHATYNSCMFGSQLLSDLIEQRPGLSLLVHKGSEGDVHYNWPVVALGAAAATMLLVWLHRLPYQATREEQISDARAHQMKHPLTASAE